MIERYDFPNDKFTKTLRLFSVVEAYGLIYPRPSSENSSLACKTVDLEWTFKHQLSSCYTLQPLSSKRATLIIGVHGVQNCNITEAKKIVAEG